MKCHDTFTLEITKNALELVLFCLGKTCNVRLENICSENPCLNGYCVPGFEPGDFSCKCFPGFSGHFCDSVLEGL